MSHQIRPLDATDAGTLVPLLTELGYPTTVEAVERRITRFRSRGDRAAYVATTQERVLGFGSIEVIDGLHDDEPIGMITALVVSAEARGRGVGTELVRALEAYARERGCVRIIVTSANHRAEAHAFYERIGYERTGVRFGRRS